MGAPDGIIGLVFAGIFFGGFLFMLVMKIVMSRKIRRMQRQAGGHLVTKGYATGSKKQLQKKLKDLKLINEVQHLELKDLLANPEMETTEKIKTLENNIKDTEREIEEIRNNLQ